MPDRNYRDRNNDQNRPNAIERDRMERRRQVRRKSMISNALVIGGIAGVVIGIIVCGGSFTSKNKKDAKAEPTTVTATIAASTQKPKETTAPRATQAADQNYAASSQDDYDETVAATEGDIPTEAPAPTNVIATSASSGTPSGGGSNTLHYSASGQTSYGYDWSYSGGGGIVSIDCGYDFSSHTYDFRITGIAPGTATITLYYNTDDGVQQPVYMTVNVDNNLNVTQIG